MQNKKRIEASTKLLDFIVPFQRLFDTTLMQQKENFFLWVPVIFAVGVGAYFSISFEPPLMVVGIVWGILASVYIFTKENKIIAPISLITLIVFSGFSAATLRTNLIYTPILEKKTGARDIESTISRIEKMEEGNGSRIALINSVIEDIPLEKTPRKIRLTLRKDDGIQIGQRIKVLASLTPPSASFVPDGFDFRRYLFFQGIGAVGFIYRAPEILENQPQTINLEQTRHFITQKITDALPENHAAIATALIVGSKTSLNDEDKQAIRDAGLAHMLAISGLHVGLVAGVMFFLLRLSMASIPSFALKYPIKKIAAVSALFCAAIYMLLAGATIPTQRAVTMCAIVFLAVILDRSPISLRLIAFTALIVLIFSPESLISASFHMSFAAVTCLVYFFDVTRSFWVRTYTRSNWFKIALLYFLGVCTTTLIASCATAPFALYHFGQVSFVGSLANLVAVPLLAFMIMPFALLSVILMPLGLEFLPLQIVGLGIKAMLDIAYWAADLPYAVYRMPAWSFGSFLLLVISFIWMIIWKGKGKALGLIGIFTILSNGLTLQMPDILLSPSHKLFAINNQQKLFVSTRRADRFVRKNWERFYGYEEGSSKLLPYKGAEKDIDNFHTCGEEGCRLSLKGQKISYVKKPYVLASECAWADIILSVDPVKDTLCKSPYIIDKFDTYYQGAHAVWIDEEQNSVIVKNVSQTTSNRPWSAYSAKRPSDRF